MRDYGITRDCFHLSGPGYLSLIDYQAQKFYHKFLMDDTYALGIQQQTGSITNNGVISDELWVGKNNGEVYTGIAGFNVVMPDTALDKASLFFKIEEIIGDPLLDNALTINVINGNFGTSTAIEAADLASNGTSDLACTFGSKTVGNWVRFDLPTTLFSQIIGGNVQVKLSATPTTNSLVRFVNSNNNDFQPVLNLKFGNANLSTATIDKIAPAVYPNPTKQTFTISTELPVDAIQLVDLTGRMLHFQQLDNKTIDIQEIPTGTYILHYQIQGTTFSQKVMKM